MLTVYRGKHYLDFTVNPDGRIDFCQEEKDAVVEEKENLDFSDSVREIEKLREKICVKIMTSVDSFVKLKLFDRRVSNDQRSTVD